MAQAAFSHSMALVAPHHWMIDADARRLIDWVRLSLIELADDFFNTSPAEMRRCLAHRAAEIDFIIDRLPSGADYDRVCQVRARIVELGNALGRTTPDQLADRLMVAAILLLTGTSYTDGDSPAEFDFTAPHQH